jgi:phosphoserine phosphatase
MIFKWISKNIVWRILNHLVFAILRFDLTRFIALLFLMGTSKIELEIAANRFYHEVLLLKQNKSVIEKINAFRENQYYSPILISGTLDFIAKIVADNLGIPIFYSSSVAYHAEICSGRLRQDILLEKLITLKNNHLYPPYDVTITDNYDDLNLIKNSRYSYIVVYSSTKKKWKKLLTKNSINNYELILIV